jgi:inosine triphosphate pyrophosphatase
VTIIDSSYACTPTKLQAKEIDALLADYAATHSPSTSSIVDLRVLEVDLPELQEVDTMAIAKNKALLAAQLANGACLVEDTSLHFHALGGMPGPYIKWFQETLKSAGLYNILAAYEDKSATAVCTLAFSPAPHADPVLFTGECHGQIVPPEPGEHGFGWDSIFVPDEELYEIDSEKKSENDSDDSKNEGFYRRRSFSQMSMVEKNKLSHRGKAVRQLAAWLGRNQEALHRRQQGEPAVGHQGLNFIETTTRSKIRMPVENDNSKNNDNNQSKEIISCDESKRQ